jgi:electron transport complex protein RnfC
MVEEYNLLDCFECGSCSYVCPSHIPLVQRFRTSKAVFRERQAS